MPAKISRVLIYLILIVFSLITFTPFVWGILASLKTIQDLFRIPSSFLPEKITLENYYTVLSSGYFLRDNVNSLIIAVSTTTLTLIICSLTGYALSKFQFKGRNAIFLGFLGTMMIPVQVTMIPVFILTSRLKMLNTFPGIIFPMAANAYGVFLMRQFILTIPDTLIEASRIDGCPEFKIYYQIAIPLAKPAIGTLGILTFLGSWNEFLWPLILFSKNEMSTVQIGLRRFQGEYGTDWNFILAAAVLAIIPVTVVFLLFQRYIIDGISTTGLKE
jgi:ABC-type glycerol-3-phosphate transport system permease component